MSEAAGARRCDPACWGADHRADLGPRPRRRIAPAPAEQGPAAVAIRALILAKFES
jgi:hypothetical protein